MSNILSNPPPGYVDSIRALNPMGSGVLMIGGSLISFANVLAAFSICYSCLVHPRIDRVPHLCAAVIELLLGVLTIASLVYSMMHDVLMPPTACTAVGFLTHLTVSVDIVIALCLAIGTWARLNDSYRSKTGRYDWKIWISVLAVPIILCCVALGMNGFGDDIYWCHVQPTTTGATIGLASLIAINYITLALVTYFHLSSISRQHQVSNLSYTVGMGTIERHQQRQRQSLAEPINILTPNQPASIRGLYPPSSTIGFDMPSPALVSSSIPPPKRNPEDSLTMYITVHFLQHTPTTIYCICMLSGFQAWWVYFLFVAGFHIGSIAKAILFHRRRRTAEETRTQRSIHGRSLAVPSMIINHPSELERPVPSWLGPEHRISHLWASNSTLATVNSTVPTTSTNQHIPSFTIQNVNQIPIINNNIVTRQSVYPDTTTYPFRHTSVSFGTTSDSSGAPSAVASRRNVDVAPLNLNESSKSIVHQRASAPMKIQLESDDEEEDDDEPLQAQRAERISFRT